MKPDPGIKRILCIRPDNMGDILMSTPAIRALKDYFGAHITLLTSRQGSPVAGFIPEIDATIVADLPWVKLSGTVADIGPVIEELRSGAFDLAVIFTVFSQSALPSALLAWMAGIPRRLAYARENPYELLTHWVPDDEPFGLIHHQVHRDLKLVATIGARTLTTALSLEVPAAAGISLSAKLGRKGVDETRPFMILHAGTTDLKREYAMEKWIAIGKKVIQRCNVPLLLTGSEKENKMTYPIWKGIDDPLCYNLAGQLKLDELLSLIKKCRLLITVNSLPVHIASALKKPVVVVYAKTNPQHTPWQTPHQVLYFEVPQALQSQNRLLHFMARTHCWQGPEATVNQVVTAVVSMLHQDISCEAVASTLS
jgi:lipopolysaccharide heptosyltransferase II